ncbi:MAG: extracellular solute-binding protein [Candidatus Limnocylindrales bacterium]|jgi:arabinogalactan oligomer/maltooligosaccharide transport system substrate-binding protein
MKTLSRLGSLVAVAILAAACSSSSATPTSGAGTMSGSLTIWDAYASGGGSEGAAMEVVLAKAKTAFPNLKITEVVVPFSDIYTKVETAWGSGETSPDMYIAPNDNLGTEQREGILMQVDDAMAPVQSNFTQVSLDGAKVNGHFFEIPESMKAISMLYNKSLVTNVPKTTDDLLALAKAGTKIGIMEYAGGYYNWWIFNAFGGQPLMDSTGKCTAESTGVSDGLAYLKALKDTGNVTFYTTEAAAESDFETGKLGIDLEGPWATGDFEKALTTNLGIAEIPAGPKGKALPMSAPDGWYININISDAQKALATQFALWEVSAAGGEQTFADQAGHLPAVKDATVKDPISQGFAAQIIDSYPRPQTKQLGAYWSNWGNAFDSVVIKGTDPVAAVATACDAMNKANGF